MRIFLTGGYGSIGKHLLPLLHNHQVLMVGRSDRSCLHLQDNISYIRGDLADLPHLEEKIKKFSPEACIHLAWEGIPDYSFSTCLKNFNTSIRLFDFLASLGCKTIFTAGTCWEYGDLKGPVCESDIPANMNLFASIKSGLRVAGQSIFNSPGTNFIWGRFFFVYGPGQRETSLIPSCIRTISEGKMPDIKNPDAVNDFIHIQDASNAIVSLIETPGVSGVVNIGSGMPTKVIDVCKIISKKMGATFKSPVVENTLKGNGCWADLSCLREQIRWMPEISLEEGVQMTLNSFLEDK